MDTITSSPSSSFTLRQPCSGYKPSLSSCLSQPKGSPSVANTSDSILSRKSRPETSSLSWIHSLRVKASTSSTHTSALSVSIHHEIEKRRWQISKISAKSFAMVSEQSPNKRKLGANLQRLMQSAARITQSVWAETETTVAMTVNNPNDNGGTNTMLWLSNTVEALQYAGLLRSGIVKPQIPKLNNPLGTVNIRKC